MAGHIACRIDRSDPHLIIGLMATDNKNPIWQASAEDGWRWVVRECCRRGQQSE
ncbi:MAG: hypothetical protein BroJett015_15880 [Chloroflexota bacterium]|nr:MAG: hypothetical protein BroJett015_15880 [Chloroflexota bacterium]